MRVNNKRETWIGSAYLMLASLIWGAAFVAQSVGMDYVGPFTFNCVRNLLGSAVLVPCMLLLKKIRHRSDSSSDASAGSFSSGPDTGSGMARRTDRRLTLTGGIVCGFFLCIASNLQQVGIKYTTIGKAGFITAMYIVIVPLLGICIGQKVSLRIWISVAMSVAGLYLLCMQGGLHLEKGDLYVMACAVAFAFQILSVSYYARRVNGVELACLEFLFCGLFSLPLVFLFENPSAAALGSALIPLLYAGIMSSGVAYTFQILGQARVSPALASIIMSFESVISLLAGWILLGERLSGRELTGCIIIFAAILLAQL